MKQELTLKQRKWLDVYLKTGNATEAAMQSYDLDPKDPKARNKAGLIGYENVRKIDYEEFLEAAGVTDHLLQRKIYEGLEATRTVSAVKTSKNATADSTDFVDVPDFMARHKYLETALKLKKRLVERHEVSGKDGQPLQINIIAYGPNDPVPIRATPSYGGSTSGPTSVSSTQLASESTEDNTSSK